MLNTGDNSCHFKLVHALNSSISFSIPSVHRYQYHQYLHRILTTVVCITCAAPSNDWEFLATSVTQVSCSFCLMVHQ